MGVEITDDERTALIELLTPELRARVESGECEVLPGQSDSKPVVRKASGKPVLVPGSGRYPNANNAADISRKSAHKRTSNYREALEKLVPLEEGADKKGSFAWMLDQFMAAVVEERQTVKCQHCGEEGVYLRKGNPAQMYKLIENLSGKAKETRDVNVHSEELVQVVNERFDSNVIEVHAIHPDEAAKRQQSLNRLMSGDASPVEINLVDAADTADTEDSQHE